MLGIGAVIFAILIARAGEPVPFAVWMRTEQIVFSLIMIGVGDFLTSDHMREVFRKPEDQGGPTA